MQSTGINRRSEGHSLLLLSAFVVSTFARKITQRATGVKAVYNYGGIILNFCRNRVT